MRGGIIAEITLRTLLKLAVDRGQMILRMALSQEASDEHMDTGSYTGSYMGKVKEALWGAIWTQESKGRRPSCQLESTDRSC
ncbi:Uu.00g000080.m01.CDS01 [Anthostomella pinea]|uniref:Uu.00g000080.m01.CDS01 n=1 Tax=Anthostomella pinea TaxID=933095 RepID=A0AAI8YFZ5_9PEZI|nr:Uu.00g000080.m01.CDS01 [Anthostomella pinea]